MSGSSLPWSRRLAVKASALLVVVMLCGLSLLGISLFLSYQVEAGVSAADTASSLRMQIYRIGLNLESISANLPGKREQLEKRRQEFRETMALLRDGNPSIPLHMPRASNVRTQFLELEKDTASLFGPWLERSERGLQPKESDDLREELDKVVTKLTNLVVMIDKENAKKRFWVNVSQVLVVSMVIIGGVLLIYLLHLLIFRPITRLREGIARMSEKDFNIRVEVGTNDEIGELARDFNNMADCVSRAYGSLERRIKEKTSELNKHNRELSLLYNVASFLNTPGKPQEVCAGFLTRTMSWFNASGGGVYLTDPTTKLPVLLASKGLPSKEDGALLGNSVRFKQASTIVLYAHDRPAGQLILNFKEDRPLTHQETQMLDTLGRRLMFSLETQRLIDRERQVAVTEDRNLLAQNVHDNVTQGLSFINLQVQMLEESLSKGNTEQANKVLPLLRARVKESYESMRKLLSGVSARLSEGELEGAFKTVINKFCHEAKIPVDLEYIGQGLPPSANKQLQLLFVVQSSLERVRKNAKATQVVVRYHNEAKMMLEIFDNGVYVDASHDAENAIGLAIMRERVAQIGAQLVVEYAEQGTSVRIIQKEQKVKVI